MPSVRSIINGLVALAPLAAAAPAGIVARQEASTTSSAAPAATSSAAAAPPAAAPGGGLSDVDILQLYVHLLQHFQEPS